ncbi:MAG: hypothetical protein A2428_08650 [Bdellovibrionales bacterium RIFOXYC1_FULL_54_43]|nr:MAG: hypothetical protein A2428_08650 [Bdellovibrionales bacterium RIFOXYC1_FULL_54_43]OFZ84285.1 MAG: hypothetical protein A2603_15230 [Bdellovibrionales bacterium RIFOXYD1_FULL_55_31]
MKPTELARELWLRMDQRNLTPKGSNAAMTLRKLLLVTTTLFLSFFSLIAIVAVARHFGIEPRILKDPNHVFHPGAVATVIAILLVPIGIVTITQFLLHQSTFRSIGATPFSAIDFAKGFFAGLAAKAVALVIAIVASEQVSFALAIPADTFAFGIETWALLFCWYLALLVLNSINEELVYRAYPIGTLVDNKTTHRLAFLLIIAAALLFSLMHFVIEEPSLWRFLYRLAFGGLTGLVFLETRRIAPLVGIHTGWNFVALSFSDTDWRMGGLLHITGLAPTTELHANVFVLAAATLMFFLLQKQRSARMKHQLERRSDVNGKKEASS